MVSRIQVSVKSTQSLGVHGSLEKPETCNIPSCLIPRAQNLLSRSRMEILHYPYMNPREEALNTAHMSLQVTEVCHFRSHLKAFGHRGAYQSREPSPVSAGSKLRATLYFARAHT